MRLAYAANLLRIAVVVAIATAGPHRRLVGARFDYLVAAEEQDLGRRARGGSREPPRFPPHERYLCASNQATMCSILETRWLGRRLIPWGSPGTRTRTVSTPSSLS